MDSFAYLRKVFAAAGVGAAFIFMDAAYHLWREVVEVFGSLRGDEGAGRGAQCFAVLHPQPQPWQCMSTMIVTRLS